MRLLELFGYIENGEIRVPVFLPEHQGYISGIADIAQKLMGEEMSAALGELSGSIDITAVRLVRPRMSSIIFCSAA